MDNMALLVDCCRTRHPPLGNLGLRIVCIRLGRRKLLDTRRGAHRGCPRRRPGAGHLSSRIWCCRRPDDVLLDGRLRGGTWPIGPWRCRRTPWRGWGPDSWARQIPGLGHRIPSIGLWEQVCRLVTQPPFADSTENLGSACRAERKVSVGSANGSS